MLEICSPKIQVVVNERVDYDLIIYSTLSKGLNICTYLIYASVYVAPEQRNAIKCYIKLCFILNWCWLDICANRTVCFPIMTLRVYWRQVILSGCDLLIVACIVYLQPEQNPYVCYFRFSCHLTVLSQDIFSVC